jgi:hypothetical protein
MTTEAGTQSSRTRSVEWTIEFKVRCSEVAQAEEITRQLGGHRVTREDKDLTIKGDHKSAEGIAAVLHKHFPNDVFPIPPHSPASTYGPWPATKPMT